MSNLNIHAATLTDGLSTRLIVAYKQIPGAPLKALVIKVDSLVRTVDRDELLILAKSSDAQREKDFINVLHRKGLLQFYQTNKFFETVSVDEVLMTPGDGKKIPLRQIINAINGSQGVGDLPSQEQMDNISKANPHAVQQANELLDTSNKKNIARSIFVQAKMLQDEADKKFEQAVGLDPELRQAVNESKGGHPISQPIVVDVSSASNQTQTEETGEPKRKRGRQPGFKVAPKPPAAPAA